MAQSFELIKDQTVQKDVRYVSVMGDYNRYDVALMTHTVDKNKIFVIDLNKNRYALVDQDKVGSQAEIAHLFQVSGFEAEELISFLKSIL
ncbi:hypothetical protein JNUCC1_03084 [Lentibacillus sp. JNUCC-1]|uniref:SAV0927 family protein n=1 Tax=Lentibacillus sp. JNUCC-1 TaxID=2654513 RepID=UPI0013208BF4|nr:SAV0927 family protein [Lentibacillus sp. JNUCC-1]MUV39211.1 hypothetical protein [Lentibacillus sp. JNUCC-1]